MDDFQFIAGDIALDFVNTVADRLARPRERLETGGDVDRWARGARLLGPRESLHLNAHQVVGLHGLREGLYRLLLPMSRGGQPAAEEIAWFERTRARAARDRHLVWRDGRLSWEWSDSGRLTGPIIEAAAELLVSVPSHRLRQCADAGCGWVFLDRSRAGRRRWCRMVDCGNRAKARRHYQRSRPS